MSPSARRPFAAREQRMRPERLVHDRERAGGKRVLARQACPTARCAASCCPARRGQVDAGGLVQPQRGQLLRLRGLRFLAGQQLRPRVAPPHRPGREHVTPAQRPVQLLQHAQRVGAVVDRPGGHVGAAKTSRRYDPVISDPATSSPAPVRAENASACGFGSSPASAGDLYVPVHGSAV